MNWALQLGIAAAIVTARHPLHSSVTTVTQGAGAVRADVRVRVFADDFPPGRDTVAIRRYLDQALVFTTETGRRLPLRLRAQRIDGSALLLEADLDAPGGLRGVRVLNRLVTDRFADQINVLKAAYGGQSATLLFLATDGAKPIP